jgi:hypothetical protein
MVCNIQFGKLFGLDPEMVVHHDPVLVLGSVAASLVESCAEGLAGLGVHGVLKGFSRKNARTGPNRCGKRLPVAQGTASKGARASR